MAWEQRGNRSYYYSAEKVNGRVEKRYLGSGPVAQAVARLEQMDRDHKEDDARPLRRELSRLDALDTLMAAFHDAVEHEVNETLTRAGYHRHDRGAWRRKRRARQEETE